MEKEHTHKEIELRSEEVQEVMNRVPAWILRSGITVLFVIVVALVVSLSVGVILYIAEKTKIILK